MKATKKEHRNKAKVYTVANEKSGINELVTTEYRVNIVVAYMLTYTHTT